MPMRFRKSMGMLLCSMMLVFMAACGSSGEKSSTETDNTGGKEAAVAPAAENAEESGEAAEEAEADPASTTPEMDFDMGGRTIKWVSWYE